LTLMGLSFKTVTNHERNDSRDIVAVTLCLQRDADIDEAEKKSTHIIKYTALRSLDKPFPLDFVRNSSISKSVKLCSSNHEMLSFIFNTIGDSDPDVIIGHHIVGDYLDVLLHMAKIENDGNWSRLGRLRLSKQRYLTSNIACRGRLVCDTYVMAQELIKKQKSYDLAELAEKQLHESGHKLMDVTEVPSHFATSESLKQLIAQNEDECRLAMRIADKMKILSLTKQLTEIAGNLWGRTLAGHRAERVEYLLLHEFHSLKFIVPEKKTFTGKGSEEVSAAPIGGKRKKAAYKGGMVLDAEKGFYDSMVVLLDFKSLYPSLIQEFNVCFTTVNYEDNPDPKSTMKYIAKEPEKDTPQGILPRVLKSLVSKRREVREKMKSLTNPSELSALDIRQSALKLIANSLYGCLGFEYSRFYAQPLAELVTRKGRETLLKSKELAERSGLSVIYGDTDSLMINTNVYDLEEAKKEGRSLMTEINKEYKTLEIDLEAVFNRLLLLKKKNYACLNAESGKREEKGLYLVRRDWCDSPKKPVSSFWISYLQQLWREKRFLRRSTPILQIWQKI